MLGEVFHHIEAQSALRRLVGAPFLLVAANLAFEQENVSEGLCVVVVEVRPQNGLLKRLRRF